MIRLLFVDDESLLLDGLRRLLRPRKADWEMEFVDNGESALSLLKAKRFDVVVSDMRMPGLDGAGLLAQVKALCPETVRLILSGQSSSQSLMRGFGVAHQYLSKPCDALILQQAIDRALALRSLFDNDTMREIARHADNLPSIPSVYQELVAHLRDSNASVGDAARIISQDLAMTITILKMVNTAFFGQRQPVASIDRAATILGLDFIMALVLEHGLFAPTEGHNSAHVDIEALRRHSVRTANVARIIAQEEHGCGVRPEDAFLTGVVHDIGLLAAAVTMPEKYRRLAPLATAHTAEYADMERSVLGADHASIGAFLLARWGFDNAIVEAVACHESPDRTAAPGLGLAGIVHVAHGIALHPTVTDCADPRLGLQTGYLSRLGLIDRYSIWQQLAYRALGDGADMRH